MKKLTIILFIIFLASQGFLNAQTFPGTFNYQAVARNDDGSAIENTEIIVEVSILQGSDCAVSPGSCNLIWQELHYPKTNEFGLFSINIGSGQNTFAGSASAFDGIDWNDFSAGSYFLKIRVDFGASSYVNGLIDVGTVKFQSVPYALTSQNAQDLYRDAGKVPVNITELQDVNISALANDEVLAWNGTNWVNTNVSSGGTVSLDDLTDVSVSSPSNNQLIYYNGAAWENTSFLISQLSDVSVSSPSAGQVIYHNGTNWTNSNISVSELSDVSISSPTVGQAIVWNGTDWVNQDVSGSSVWTDDGTYVFYNGGNNVGIGTSTPTTGFHYLATADDGFVVSGTFNTSGAVYNYGDGTRMSFFPSKAAFRAGRVSGTEWNDVNTGDYSAAFGRNNIASATYSTAFGYNNEAQGVASLVGGTGNISIGLNSLVVGTNNNLSSGLDADNSIVGGQDNDAYSASCLIVGSGNDAYADNSIIFGESSKNDATGTGSLSGGNGTNARGNYSVAFGVGTTAGAYASMVLGRYNTIGSYSANSWNSSEPVIIIGNGTGQTSRNNAMIFTKDGNITIEGTVTESSPNPSKASNISNFNDIFYLQGIYYNSKYGLNPDNVQNFFPELITDFNKGKAINYSGFVPVLIETVKSQKKQIDFLKQENELLKKQIDDINKRLLKIEQKN